jgi:hypothetical protein
MSFSCAKDSVASSVIWFRHWLVFNFTLSLSKKVLPVNTVMEFTSPPAGCLILINHAY